jgi:hypothetical protein
MKTTIKNNNYNNYGLEEISEYEETDYNELYESERNQRECENDCYSLIRIFVGIIFVLIVLYAHVLREDRIMNSYRY